MMNVHIFQTQMNKIRKRGLIFFALLCLVITLVCSFLNIFRIKWLVFD